MTKKNNAAVANNETLNAFAAATGISVSPKVSAVHNELAAIAESKNEFSKEIRASIADRHGVPSKLVGMWAGLYGLTLSTGRAPVATKESVGDALADLGIEATDTDAPERVAKELGLKTSQAVTRILRDEFGRPAGKRGRSAEPLELDALHESYLRMFLYFASMGASRPHNAALLNASTMITGEDRTVRINSEFTSEGLATFANENCKKDPSVLDRVRAALAEYETEE